MEEDDEEKREREKLAALRPLADLDLPPPVAMQCYSRQRCSEEEERDREKDRERETLPRSRLHPAVREGGEGVRKCGQET